MKSQESPKFLRKQTEKRAFWEKSKVKGEKNWVGSSSYNFWSKTVYLAEAKLQATVKVTL